MFSKKHHLSTIKYNVGPKWRWAIDSLQTQHIKRNQITILLSSSLKYQNGRIPKTLKEMYKVWKSKHKRKKIIYISREVARLKIKKNSFLLQMFFFSKANTDLCRKTCQSCCCCFPFYSIWTFAFFYVFRYVHACLLELTYNSHWK